MLRIGDYKSYLTDRPARSRISDAVPPTPASPAAPVQPGGAQRVYIAPISDFAVGDVGPTRFEYITHFGRQEPCETIAPTSRRAQADYEVWFEFEGARFNSRHYMIVWDADGAVVAMGEATLSENIVKDACEAMMAHVASGGEPVQPPVEEYPTCEAMREAGWIHGVNQDGDTYQGAWDEAERETYSLNRRARSQHGRACVRCAVTPPAKVGALKPPRHRRLAVCTCRSTPW